MANVEFQTHVHNLIRQRFPPNEGWQILKQPALTASGMIEFLVNSPKIAILAAANDKEELERSDVDTLLVSAADRRAERAIIYAAYDTKISEIVAKYAKGKGVELIQTQWWQDD